MGLSFSRKICCISAHPPDFLYDIFTRIPDLGRFLVFCGLPTPPQLPSHTECGTNTQHQEKIYSHIQVGYLNSSFEFIYI